METSDRRIVSPEASGTYRRSPFVLTYRQQAGIQRHPEFSTLPVATGTIVNGPPPQFEGPTGDRAALGLTWVFAGVAADRKGSLQINEPQ